MLISLLVENPLYSLLALVGGILGYHVLAYLADAHGYNKGDTIPGPWLAKFSDLWLARKAVSGDRSGAVHALHQKYGPVVRIAPNHISIADPDALQIVYAHGNGSLKSGFYDAFVSIHRGLFNTRDRVEHTRKRKIVSNIFSQKNVLEFEPYVRAAIEKLLKQWDRLYESTVLKGEVIEDGKAVYAKDRRVWFDCLSWLNFLAFDIIGDLAFGSPFGMVEAGRDSAPVLAQGDTPDKIQHLPAIKILNDRGDYSASLGVTPQWLWPVIKKIPWFARGKAQVQNLAGIAVAAVQKRLAEPTDRNDLLSKLQQGKDSDGQPMGIPELTAEALTQLIAGSDTTSNSSCAITYYLAKYPEAQAKLHAELDIALGPVSAPLTPDAVATYDQVKSLPYLDACINEGLRLHSTSSMGLPRIVPKGGLTVAGRTYEEGCVLSVPSFTIHRSQAVWGEDVEVYRPERWFEEERKEAIQKTFNPFSWGPRACVGKNLATMELLIIIGTLLHRYEFVLTNEAQKLETREGFLRKPIECWVGMKRRD